MLVGKNRKLTEIFLKLGKPPEKYFFSAPRISKLVLKKLKTTRSTEFQSFLKIKPLDKLGATRFPTPKNTKILE